MSDWENATIEPTHEPTNEMTNDSGDAGPVEQKKTAQDLGWSLPVKIDYAAATSKDPVQPFYHTTNKYEYNGDVGDLGPKVSTFRESLQVNTVMKIQFVSSRLITSSHIIMSFGISTNTLVLGA